MKNLFLAFMTLVSFSVFADTVILDAKHVTAPEAFSGEKTIEVVRTSETPAKVWLHVNVLEKDSICIRWATRTVYVPGRHERHCTRRPDGHVICHDRWIPGYYRTETYCAEYGAEIVKNENKYVLDFKKAATLAEGESEIFAITFNQRDDYSPKLKMAGEAVSTQATYVVKRRCRLFCWKGLKFQAE